MSRNIQVHQPENSPLPQAHIPRRHAWDLIEYLAFHRTPVQITYKPNHFIVTFLRLKRLAAQKLLDHWSARVPHLSP